MKTSPRQRGDYSDRQIEAAKRVLLDIGQKGTPRILSRAQK